MNIIKHSSYFIIIILQKYPEKKKSFSGNLFITFGKPLVACSQEH